MPPDGASGPAPDVLLVRHGETAWNLEGRIQGHTDVPLSPRGIEQTRRLAERLAASPPARIVSSDLGRALETARAVARRVGREVETDAMLREQHLGAWQGLTGEEARARDPGLYAARFLARDPHARPPGGETRAEMQERVWRALLRHAGPGSSGPLLLVTHGGVVSALVYRVLGLPLEAPRRFLLPNTAITTLLWRQGGWRLGTLCDVSHAPVESGEPTFPFD
jgi:broad specificity phosphatase PhoE